MAALAEQGAAAARHPALVHRRMGAGVALLADQAEDRAARRREEPARLLDRRRVHPVLGVAETDPGFAAGVDAARRRRRAPRGASRARGVGGTPKKPVRGFSTMTCFPRRAAATSRARRGDAYGTQRSTTSTSGRRATAATSSSTRPTPNSSANARPAPAGGRHRSVSSTSTPVTCRYASAWIRATKPAPTSPTRTRRRSPAITPPRPLSPLQLQTRGQALSSPLTTKPGARH